MPKIGLAREIFVRRKTATEGAHERPGRRHVLGNLEVLKQV